MSVKQFAVADKTDRRGGRKRAPFGRFRLKHRGEVKSVAIVLAGLMLFSIFGANVSSIVKLFETSAARTGNYYTSKVTLYDYYTDNEIKGGSDNNANDGVNRNAIFNSALYESGYVKKAGTWGSLNYFPLYLGLQYPGQTQGNQMINDSSNRYKYSIVANSQAGTGSTSYAVQGLVDNELMNGKITQGNSVVLPYFDEDFLRTPISTLLSSASVSGYGISNASSKTVGSKTGTYEFLFKKNTSTGYYEYDAATQGLGYSAGRFTVGTGSTQSTLTSGTGNGKGFLPYATMGLGKNYGFGSVFEIPFTMSSDGCKTTLSSGNVVSTTDPIIFNFSGDDDVWVFIDDQLVLDIGGAHGKVTGNINFKTKKASVERYKTDLYHQNNYTGSLHGTGNLNADGSYEGGSNRNISAILDEIGLYDDTSKEHVMKVFYIERGSLESNCLISFNFQIADMISISNRFDANTVTDPALRGATDQVLAKEAVEYKIASNSAQSSMDSPDVEKYPEKVEPKGKYTLSFVLGKNAYGSIPSQEVKEGKKIMLPMSASSVTRTGYSIVGWSETPPPSLTSPSGATLVANPYTMPGGNKTLYAVWDETPVSPFTLPPSPTLFFIDTPSGYKITQCKTGDASVGDSRSSDWQTAIGNLTYKDLLYEIVNFYCTHQRSDGQYGDCQHPRDDQNFTVNSSASGGNIIRESGQIKIGGSGATDPYGVYVWHTSSIWVSNNNLKANTDISKTSLSFNSDKTISNANSTFVSNTNANNWIKAYMQLYNNLVNWANNANNDLAMLKNPDIRAAYEDAVETYKHLTYMKNGSQTNPDTVFDNFIDAVNNAPQIDTSTYSLSYNGTTTFYIYATSQPTVRSNNSYDGDNIENSPNYSDDKSYTVSAFSVPSGITPVDDGTGSYYQVTVDTNVIKTKLSDNSTQTLDNNLVIEVGGTQSIVKATDFVGTGFTYPCYYVTEAVIKDIDDDFPTTQYGFADYATIWFFSTNNIAGQTVECKNTIDGNNATVTNTLTADPDVLYYYYTVVPKTAVKKEGQTRTTEIVQMSLNSTNVSFSSTASGYTSPCYFLTNGTGGSSNIGWYNLNTIVVDNVGWWPDIYLFIQAGASHPLAASSWPTTTLKMTEIGTDSNPDCYYYTPDISGKDVVFKIVSGSQPSGWDNAWRSSENFEPTVSSDAYFQYSDKDGSGMCSFNSPSAIGSSSTYYQYTAKSKSISRRDAYISGNSPAILNSSGPLDLDEDELLTDSVGGEEDPIDDAAEPYDGPVTDLTDDSDLHADPDDTEPGDTLDDLDDPDDFVNQEGNDETSDPVDVTNDPASAGSNPPKSGQFVNSSAPSFKMADATNFKLFDDHFSALTAEETDYVVRQTSGDGTFNLMDGQTARFTYQFNRGSKLKIGEDGLSYSFSDNDKDKGTTVLPPGSTYEFGTAQQPNTVVSSATNLSTAAKPLYHRYSTSWEMTDDNEDTPFTQNQRYIASKADTSGTNYQVSTDGTITMKNLNGDSPADNGIHLNLEYTNTVRVGELTIKKKLTDEAIQAILDYRQTDNTYNPEFYFAVDFSHIFGDPNSETVSYHGDYYLSGSSTATNTYKEVNNTYVIAFKYGDLYSLSTTTLNAAKASYNNSFKVTIKNIPVLTEYTIHEEFETPAAGSTKPEFEFKTVTITTVSGQPIAGGAAVTSNAVTGTIVTELNSSFTPLDPSTSVSDVSYEQYRETLESGSQINFEAENGIKSPDEAYLIIRKYIDKLYYSENDDPAGLLASTLARQQATGNYTPSFSGPTGTASDPNGYQGATDAEQTFIFKVSEYTEPDFSDIEPTVFYETVSFGSSDGTMKYKVMKINPGRYYRVEEMSDWSWKYEHTNTQVTNTPTNSVSSKVGYLKAFTETITPSSGHTYQNAAMVTFTNYKYARDNDPQRKVEGDTAVEVNRFTKPAS